MKTLIAIATLAGISIATITPASAQYGWGHSGYGNRFYGNINNQQARILSRLNAGQASGRLNAREYTNLMRAYNNIAAREAQLRAGGLNWRERQQLSNRLNSLQNRVFRQSIDRQYGNRFNRGWW